MGLRGVGRVGLLLGVIACGCGAGGGDPGPTPTPSPSPAPQRAARLWMLAADDPDPRAGRAVLLRSDDLGTTWQSLADTGLAETTTAIDFLDADHGVAVGGRVAQRTDDAGRTWATQLDDPRSSPEYLSLAGVHLAPSGTASALGNVVNDSFLNASGYETYVLPPDGSPPQSATVRTTPLARIESMCITASGTGVAVGGFRFTMALLAYSTTLGTSDGGATWSLLESIAEGVTTWSGAACAGEKDLWRFGVFGTGGPLDPHPVSGATIEHSVDGGASWDGPVDRAGVGDASLVAGSFVDRDTGWLAGSDGYGPVVLHTTDGGATLVRQPLPPGTAGGLSSIAFANDRVGIVAGNAFDAAGRSLPRVAVTSDGGATWTLTSPPSGVSRVIAVDAVP